MPSVTVETPAGETTFEDAIAAEETDDGTVKVTVPASGGDETKLLSGSLVGVSLTVGERKARRQR